VTGAVRRASTPLVLAVTVGSLAACGSSSSSSSSTGDASAANAVTSAGATDNSPIDSPAYRKLIILAGSQKGLSPQVAAKVADCVVKKEKAQGYKTIADLGKTTRTRQQAVQNVAECTSQALPAG
jgi:hypothetical protein